MNIEGVITLMIMVLSFYLYYKNEKESQRKIAKKETIDFYKKQYKPFTPDDRLPIISKDGYELKDIALTATEMVYESPIPNEEEVNSLVKGDFVKLKFLDKSGEVERMWVEYLRKEDDLHLGILRNDSFDDSELSYGKHIYFHSNHIFIIEKSWKTFWDGIL